jgi:N-acetylmuramic acid 6-phosphate (MurNAc-6-P) etherase
MRLVLTARQQVATTRVDAVTAARLFEEAGVKTTIAMQKLNLDRPTAQAKLKTHKENLSAVLHS